MTTQDKTGDKLVASIRKTKAGAASPAKPATTTRPAVAAKPAPTATAKPATTTRPAAAEKPVSTTAAKPAAARKRTTAPSQPAGSKPGADVTKPHMQSSRRVWPD